MNNWLKKNVPRLPTLSRLFRLPFRRLFCSILLFSFLLSYVLVYSKYPFYSREGIAFFDNKSVETKLVDVLWMAPFYTGVGFSTGELFCENVL